MKTIHFFVCRHGFGHQKRVMSVASSVLMKQNEIRIVIHCNKSNFEKMCHWQDSKFLQSQKNVEFEFELMKESPVYNQDTTLSSVNQWLNPIQDYSNSIEGTIVIDNDASLLKVFPNAIMMGSFLWSEVLINKGNEELKSLALYEIDLLKKNKPFMLCVGKMATPYVKDLTQPVSLPWFCQKHPNRDRKIKERISILITAGGISTPKEYLSRIAHMFIQKGILVFVDTAIHNCSNGKIPLFSYKEEDFIKLRMVVCRPGMGILNDCIRYGIPLLAMEEKDNQEMMQNAEKIEKLGFGSRINENTTLEDILNYYNSPLLEEWQKNILNEETKGAELAANWILNFINHNQNNK